MPQTAQNDQVDEPVEVAEESPEEEVASEEKSSGRFAELFQLSKGGWWCLLIMDVMLIIMSVLTANLLTGALALVIVIIIDKFGSKVLLARYNEQLAENENFGQFKITPEMRKEIKEEMRRQRIEKRRERKEKRLAKRQKSNK